MHTARSRATAKKSQKESITDAKGRKRDRVKCPVNIAKGRQSADNERPRTPTHVERPTWPWPEPRPHGLTAAGQAGRGARWPQEAWLPTSQLSGTRGDLLASR